MGRWRVSGIFFADDLGLISRTLKDCKSSWMLVQQERALFTMKISVTKIESDDFIKNKVLLSNGITVET